MYFCSQDINILETIAITYDKNNNIVRKLLETLLLSGAKEKKSGLDEAIEDFQNGDTIKCEDFDDFLLKIKTK